MAPGSKIETLSTGKVINSGREPHLSTRSFSLTIFFSLLFFPSFTQQRLINLKDGGTVTCIAYWNKKEAVRYHVAATKETFKNDKSNPSKSIKTEYDISLNVIDSAEKTYTVDLTYSNFYCDAQEQDRDFELLKLFSKLHIKYLTTELGEFLRIINKQELANLMGPLVEKLRADMAKKIKKEDERENFNQAFDNMKSFFTDTSNVEGLFADNIYSIHSFYGWELKLNKEEQVAIDYPTIANLKLSGNGKLILTEINKTKGECKIQLAQQPEKGSLNEYAKKLMVAMLGDFSKKAKKDFASLKLGANTKLKYVMDLSTGWFTKISSTSNATVTVGDESHRTVSKVTMVML